MANANSGRHGQRNRWQARSLSEVNDDKLQLVSKLLDEQFDIARTSSNSISLSSDDDVVLSAEQIQSLEEMKVSITSGPLPAAE